MRTEVGKWGNSLAVRLPKAVAEELGLTAGTPVELILRDGTIVIARRSPRYELTDLLASVHAKNLHEAFDTQDARGREAW